MDSQLNVTINAEDEASVVIEGGRPCGLKLFCLNEQDVEIVKEMVEWFKSIPEDLAFAPRAPTGEFKGGHAHAFGHEGGWFKTFHWNEKEAPTKKAQKVGLGWTIGKPMQNPNSPKMAWFPAEISGSTVEALLQRKHQVLTADGNLEDKVYTLEEIFAD